jgi:CubicO group peptidase (beta-lactamase class C family)
MYSAKIFIGIFLKILAAFALLSIVLAAWTYHQWNRIQVVQDFSSIAELETMFTELITEENVPGMAVAIVVNGEVAWSKGFGYANVEKLKPVRPDTPFLLASISKLFTGVALMQALEQGRLSLDDNVNQYLSFAVDNPHLDDEIITLRHLATHTSGITDNLFTYATAYTKGDSDTPLTRYLTDFLVPKGKSYTTESHFSKFAPGKAFSYSNLGIDLAGEMLEAATGKPLDAYTDEHIFIPLGMKNTGWYLSDFENQDDIAVPYNFGIWPWVYLEEVAKGIPYNNEDSAYGLHGFEHFSAPGYPSSGLRASVNDVARFLAAIMNGGELDGVRVLDESTIATMFEPQFSGLEKDDFEVDEQALFWTYNDGLLGHSGGDLGANNIVFFDPLTKVGGVILLNRGSDLSALAVRQRVLHQIMDYREKIVTLLTLGSADSGRCQTPSGTLFSCIQATTASPN